MMIYNTFKTFRDQGENTCVILVLRECILNALMVSLVLPAFDDTVSLGYLPSVHTLRLSFTLREDLCAQFPILLYTCKRQKNTDK